MANRMPASCPVCGRMLEVTRLQCRHCDTGIDGHFEACRFCALTPEQQRFVEIFLKVRGNLREMERELGISYPTVRSRLDAILHRLGYRVETPSQSEETESRRREILNALSKGEITAEDAVRRLKHLRVDV